MHSLDQVQDRLQILLKEFAHLFAAGKSAKDLNQL